MKKDIKIKKIFKDISLRFKKKILSNIKGILYLFIFLVGVGMIVASFGLTDNWINVFSGVGTGLLTSLVVSVIINAENSAREKQKIEEQKRYLLNGIIESSIDIYEDNIYRINEFIILNNDMNIKQVYNLYEEFKEFTNFSESLKKIELNESTEEIKDSLKKLFSFNNYRIDSFYSELKRLPKQEYYLQGILSQKECDNLIPNLLIDKYLKDVNQLDDFWGEGIINYDMCVEFLTMTMYICSKIIATFPYSKKKAQKKENYIKKAMSNLYFEEVYSKSEEYIQNQIEQSEAEAEYYAEHPEEWEKREREYEEIENETQEEKILKELFWHICGLITYDIDELLNKLDSNSETAILFFRQEEIQRSLNKNRKQRKAVVNKFGKDYLQRKIDTNLEEIKNE